MIKPQPDFERKIAQAGISKAELARGSGVGQSTIYGMMRPQQQRGRVGGVYAQNAWKIANYVAEKTSQDAEQVFNRLFVEEEYISPVDGRRITPTPA